MTSFLVFFFMNFVSAVFHEYDYAQGFSQWDAKLVNDRSTFVGRTHKNEKIHPSSWVNIGDLLLVILYQIGSPLDSDGASVWQQVKHGDMQILRR
jgi:hypothetical protein